MRRYVYTLTDPRTSEVRYVGETDNPARRLSQHAAANTGGATWAWCRELRALDLSPRMRIAEVVEANDDATIRRTTRLAERKWLAHFSQRGARLVNYFEHRSLSS